MLEISNTFNLLGMQVSLVELVGVSLSLLSVWLAARQNQWTWSIGCASSFFLVALFIQLQLYADVVLQIIFAALAVYGSMQWEPGRHGQKRKVTSLGDITQLILLTGLVVGTCITYAILSHLHIWFPDLKPAVYPLQNSFMMAASILAIILLAKKKIEAWYLWLFVNIVGIYVYSRVGATLLTIEYCIFLLNAFYAWNKWFRELYKSPSL